MSGRPDRDPQQARIRIVLFLAGPVIWIACFWLVYLIAETACIQHGLRFEALGLPGVSLVTVALSLLAIAAVTALAVIAYRRRPRPAELEDPDEGGQGRDGVTDRHLLYWGGAILGALFALAVLMVGLPALVLTPC